VHHLRDIVSPPKQHRCFSESATVLRKSGPASVSASANIAKQEHYVQLAFQSRHRSETDGCVYQGELLHPTSFRRQPLQRSTQASAGQGIAFFLLIGSGYIFSPMSASC